MLLLMYFDFESRYVNQTNCRESGRKSEGKKTESHIRLYLAIQASKLSFNIYNRSIIIKHFHLKIEKKKKINFYEDFCCFFFIFSICLVFCSHLLNSQHVFIIDVRAISCIIGMYLMYHTLNVNMNMNMIFVL